MSNLKPPEPSIGHTEPLKPPKTPTDPPELPKGCKPLPHQVAGHRYGEGKLGIGKFIFSTSAYNVHLQNVLYMKLNNLT